MTLHVAPVRFEHHRDPLGIGEAAPRLSWIVESAPSGWRQARYVVESRGGADATVERIEVESTESVLVPWPFAPLPSRARREVRVLVAGDGGEAWSEWTGVETGLLDPGDWSARMVGPASGTAAADAASPLVRGEFVLDAEPVRARLYGTAHGIVEFHLNGERVGDEVLAPGWTAYADRLRFRTHDVTHLVRSGANAMGAWLADGWWRGRLGWDGVGNVYGDQLGVLAQLEVEYADGRRAVFGSSTQWRAAPSAIESASLYDGETFDATRFDPAWSTPGFDASEWEPTEERDRDPATLVPPDGPPVRVTETLPVREVTTSPSGRTILDFGQNLVGRLRLTVRGAAGDRVTIRHAEVLEGGELATEPLRSAKQTDVYVLRGGEPEEWAPRFTFHGFRYAEVDGWPGAFDPGSIVAEVLHSDLERTGELEVSDPLVQRLHENVVWGMRGNFVDIPTDCPQRDERLGWTGDLQVFAPTASYLADASGFLSSWLRDLAAEQGRRNGVVPMVVPTVGAVSDAPTAGWSDAATVVPWTLFERYGDREVLRRQFDSMRTWVDVVAHIAGENRLWDSGYQFGDWLDPAAPAERPDQARTAPEVVATAYFARSARIVADAAAVLGLDEEATRYGALADEVRDAFRREYVTGAGRIVSDAPTAYALALQFDLLGAEERPLAADRLATLVRESGYRIATGFLGTPVILDALSANGHADTAYKLLLQTENPSWLYAVVHGATTIWERWDSLLPDGRVNPSGMTSFNHYAFGAVADWLHRVVGGLAPADAGYRRIRVAPQPPRRGITSAGARLRTPYGEATTSWRLADGELRLTVTVPVGATAEVELPSGATHAALEHGVHEFAESFEVEADERRVVTVDTRLGDLVESAEGMRVLTGVVTKYVPDAAGHMESGLRGQDDVTPRQVAAMLPNSDAVLADFERGFAAVSAGEEIPHDVLHAPESDAADDGELRELAGLLSGADFWTTREGRGIRPLVLTDGPHGVRRQPDDADHLGVHGSLPATCFPTGAALGSSWDPDLVETVGRALGIEARALGVDVLLGPGINLKRSPLGGRNFEYLSEDPELTAELAIGWVRGVQSTGVGASLKHFAVNNQETDRMRVSAEVDERTLRELYLRAFERVIREAEPATVMSAYNAINGVFASENEWLLTELLRDEWGFDGLVVSDWGAVKDRVQALRAGLDLEMPGPRDESTAAIVDAVRDGRLDRAVVERAVERLAALAERTAARDVPAVDAEAHRALARRAAAESIVLLRNEDATLPLRAGRRIAVLGELAMTPPIQGGGSSRVNPTRVDVPLDALRDMVGEVEYAPGYSRDPGDADALRRQAVDIAAAADVAILVVGLDEAEQSEGFDREHLELPSAQVALIDAVAAVAPRTVVVLLNGGVVSLEPWHDRVHAIVEGWTLGQAVGGALADVLTGRVNPSGRLAETIPMRLEDTPSYLHFPGEHERVRYAEGVFVGYRYYETVGRAVRYPFGHGLGYTTFEHRLLQVSPVGPDAVRATVSLRNTGTVSGAEVVQLYVAPAASAVRQPRRALAGFTKVVVAPGESTTVEIDLPRRAFAHWDVSRSDWRVEPGRYGIELGRSAADIVARLDVELDGDSDAPPPLTIDSTVKEWFAHPIVGPVLLEGMMANATEEQRESADMLKMVESMPMRQFAQFPGVGLTEETLAGLIAMSGAPD